MSPTFRRPVFSADTGSGRRHANLTDQDRPMLPNPKSGSMRIGSIDADADMERSVSSSA